MEVPSGSDSTLLSPTARPIALAPRILRLDGTHAFVNTSRIDGIVVGMFWATSESAILRVLEGTQPGVVEADDGLREALPPACLLPKGADALGTLASVRERIRDQLGRVQESADYRIMVDGNFIARQLSGGRSGMKYSFRSLNDDSDPVALIGIGLAREDWKPDRSALRLG
jgi:hypothetical protein